MNGHSYVILCTRVRMKPSPGQTKHGGLVWGVCGDVSSLLPQTTPNKTKQQTNVRCDIQTQRQSRAELTTTTMMRIRVAECSEYCNSYEYVLQPMCYYYNQHIDCSNLPLQPILQSNQHNNYHVTSTACFYLVLLLVCLVCCFNGCWGVCAALHSVGRGLDKHSLLYIRYQRR
jgi:hypothetical protein